jgi:hypothetical protein
LLWSFYLLGIALVSSSIPFLWEQPFPFMAWPPACGLLKTM